MNRHHPLLLRNALVNAAALGLTWAAYIQAWPGTREVGLTEHRRGRHGQHQAII